MNMAEHTEVAKVVQPVAGRECTLPLKVLFRDPLNVRKKKATGSVDELAALILSQSLLQNLVVREELTGKKKKHSGRYGVVAGGRRLEALQLLLSQRKIDEDYPVRTLLVSQEDALSVSLAENCGHEPLHGADLFDAFQAMVAQGKTPGQIADAWGISRLTVERRLKLASVAPKLMALYREDGIALEQLIALTLADDHATQESVWKNASQWERDPHSLRRKLTERDIPPSHPLAVFVGFEVYEQFGGAVRRDLFSDDSTPGFLTEPALLERLAREALERQAEVVRAEGWAWVETRLRLDHGDRHAFEECRMVEEPPSAEQQARLDAIDKSLEELEAQWEAMGPEDNEDALIATQDQLERDREEIMAALRTPEPGELAIAGAVVYVDRQGALEVERGLVRPEDRESNDDTDSGEPGSGSLAGNSAKGVKPAKPEFTERLLRQLTAHRTAALRACVADDSSVALRLVAYQLASLVFYSTHYSNRLDQPIEIRAELADLSKDAPDLPASQAHAKMESHHQHWGDRLPGEKANLLGWLLAAEEADVHGLIAYCVARTLNAVQGREAPQPVADELSRAVKLDMADWWQPTSESYLSAVPKAKIIEALTEVGGVEATRGLDGMKKDALVSAAELRLEGSRWLPAPLRERT